MNRKSGKRHSAPSAAAGSASQGMVPWGAMGAMGTMGGPGPMFYCLSQPSSSLPGSMFGHSNQAVKPWVQQSPAVELEQEQSESDSDSDFEQPSQKNRKTSSGCKVKQTASQAQPSTSTEKRGRGRPRKEVKEDPSKSTEKIKIPRELDGFDPISRDKKSECSACHIYTGKCVMKPCNHALVCRQCIRNLRTEMIKMNRVPKCPVLGCYALVSDWTVLYNVNV